MKIPLLYLTISLQVVAFQLIWIRINRRLPDLLIGTPTMPEPTARRVAAFRERTGRTRILLGVLYLILAALAAFVVPLDLGHRKLALGVISLLSSGTLVGGFVSDVRTVNRFRTGLPDPQVRVAGLKPRSISLAYPPAWEALPIALILATLTATVWAMHHGVLEFGVRVLARPTVQIFYFLITMALTVFQVRSGSCLTWRARNFQVSPDQALALSERINRREILFLFYCRVAIVLMLGVGQTRIIREAMGHPRSTILEIAEGAILLALLGQLIIQLLRHPIRTMRASAPLGDADRRNGGAS